MSTLAIILLAAFCIGVLLAFLASAIHIRHQRAAEARRVAELVENRRFYLALIDNNLDALSVSDTQGRLRFVNKSHVEMLGYPYDQLMTEDFRIHVHPDDRAQFDREWDLLIHGKEPVNFTPFRYFDVRGRYHWKRFLTRNMIDDPDIRGLILSSSDITDLIETMENLRLSEQRIRIALSAGDIAVFNLGLDGRFTWIVNPLFGNAPEELLGRNEADLLPPEAAKRLAGLRETVVRDGGQVSDEIEFMHGNERRVITVHLEQLLDPSGQVIGVAGASADITRVRTVADQLEAVHRMEAIGKLTGGVAHDFNNLLAVIVGNLELLKDHLERDPQLGNFVNVALKAADRGSGLTRSLLAFARKQTLDVQPVDANKVLAEVAELLRRSLPPSITLNFRAEPQLWMCRADAGQLQNVIINLTVNARDAMPDGGEITISTSNTHLNHHRDAGLPPDVTPGDYVLICVADTGTGIPPDVLERVIEPFFTTKPPGQGTGLGLSIVYGFAKQLGGHLTITSPPGKGANVCLYLPRDNTEAGQRAPDHTPPFQSTVGATILVVDDDEDVRQLTTTLLKRAGYKTMEASGGSQAIDVLAGDAAIDLLLTDMLLGPGLSGLNLIDQARNLRPDLPVVLMSGYVNTQASDAQDREIAAPLLRKPFRRQELEAAVSAALASRRSASATAARRAGFGLAPDTQGNDTPGSGDDRRD